MYHICFLYGTVYFVSEIYEKMGSELTGKILQNDFFNRVWPETTIIAEFAIKNCVDSTPQTSKMIFLDPIRARKPVFIDFSLKKFDQFFLRYGQSL